MKSLEKSACHFPPEYGYFRFRLIKLTMSRVHEFESRKKFPDEIQGRILGGITNDTPQRITKVILKGIPQSWKKP